MQEEAGKRQRKGRKYYGMNSMHKQFMDTVIPCSRHTGDNVFTLPTESFAIYIFSSLSAYDASFGSVSTWAGHSGKLYNTPNSTASIARRSKVLSTLCVSVHVSL
eukprot:GHVT01047533.1.p1 GENE.GHVT01047533.1~~GHVT01047533.1.p1  ORF type:complete len:105 (+),score=4.07 GHVT01047533.1:1464-1778(+)